MRRCSLRFCSAMTIAGTITKRKKRRERATEGKKERPHEHAAFQTADKPPIFRGFIISRTRTRNSGRCSEFSKIWGNRFAIKCKGLPGGHLRPTKRLKAAPAAARSSSYSVPLLPANTVPRLWPSRANAHSGDHAIAWHRRSCVLPFPCAVCRPVCPSPSDALHRPLPWLPPIHDASIPWCDWHFLCTADVAHNRCTHSARNGNAGNLLESWCDTSGLLLQGNDSCHFLGRRHIAVCKNSHRDASVADNPSRLRCPFLRAPGKP